MIRIVVADDHAVVRRGISRILADAPDLQLVGEAASGPDLVTLVLGTPADVCVLDLAMPGGGLDLIGRLRELKPSLRILVFSMHPEAQYAVRCLAAGASGYLGKGGPAEEVEQAIRTVHEGRRFITEGVAELLASHVLEGAGALPHERLSNREFDVFRRLARGEGPGEIAEELGLSPKSVSTYRARVLQKVGVTRNAELTRYALEHGLLE